MVTDDIDKTSLTGSTVEDWGMLPRKNTFCFAKMMARKRISIIARKAEFAGCSWLINGNVKHISV